MNSCVILGRLGQDAELKETSGGKDMLKFSVANNTGFGDRKQTNWFNCVMWGERGVKIAEFLKKGTQVVVSGEITLNTYENKDGVEKSSLNLNVSNVSFAGSKEKDGDEPAAKSRTSRPASNTPPSSDFDDDDIPF